MAVTRESTHGVSRLNSLTFKQAGVTLGVVLLLSVFLSALELYLDLQSMRSDVSSRMQQTLAMVKGSAVEAAYQLNPELSRQVVDGLFNNADVAQAVLVDNFGKTLAERGQGESSSSFMSSLFDQVSTYQQGLIYGNPTNGGETVGQLSVLLSPQKLADRFGANAKAKGLIGALRIAAICALVVAIFNIMITRPILSITNAIARANPASPGSWPRPQLRGHDKDELGSMVGSLDKLLQAFQQGLNERDKAHGELAELNRDLEQRVTERTEELSQTLDALAQEKAELDAAHSKLADANKLILESIRYARRIQQSMLPQKDALGDCVADVHVHWEPLHLVGGDYFWLERFDDDQCLLAAFDCTGHGVPGAFMTLVVASALDRILHEQHLRTPADILVALDGMVRERLRQDRPDADSDDGFEAGVCMWNRKTRQMTFAGAGIGLICSPTGADPHIIRGDRAHLGYKSLTPVSRLEEHTIDVEHGTAYYLVTDGVHDQMGGSTKRLLGRKKLTNIIARSRHLPMEAQVAQLCEALDDYRGDQDRRDDETLIGFRPLA